MKNLSEAQWIDLNRLANRAADRIESDDFLRGGEVYYPGSIPPLVALKDAAIRRAAINAEISTLAAAARQSGESWGKIGASLQMTAEGAQRKFAHA